MTISLKHAFTSPKADGTDSTLVQPSNWNAEHTITLAAGKVLGRDSSSNGAMQELPMSFDTSGNVSLSATGYFLGASGTTAQRPGSASAGMFRFNTSTSKFEGYNGSAWAAVGGGGGSISDTAPASPSAGDLWWNSSDGQLYIYYNDGNTSQWVVANAFTGGAGYLPLTGGTLTGTVTGTSGTFSGTVQAATVNATSSLQVNGKQATNGPAFSAYRGTNQSVTTATWTKVQLATEEFDTANAFDSSTNYRFTPLVEGYYHVDGNVSASATSSTLQAVSCAVYKNGSIAKQGTDVRYGSTVGVSQAHVSALIYMNGSTDYLELYGYVTASNTPVIVGTASDTYFCAHMARGA